MASAPARGRIDGSAEDRRRVGEAVPCGPRNGLSPGLLPSDRDVEEPGLRVGSGLRLLREARVRPGQGVPATACERSAAIRTAKPASAVPIT